MFWAPSLPLDQVLSPATFPEPLLGDGLGGEDLVTQLVLLAPLHPGDDHLVDFDQLLLLMAMILNYDDEDDADNEIRIFCSGLMRHGGFRLMIMVFLHHGGCDEKVRNSLFNGK